MALLYRLSSLAFTYGTDTCSTAARSLPFVNFHELLSSQVGGILAKAVLLVAGAWSGEGVLLQPLQVHGWQPA